MRQAIHRKPQSLIRRTLSSIGRWLTKSDPIANTRQGSTSGSPATFEQTIIQQRYERAQIVGDCRRLELEDARVNKAVGKYAAEATRGGVKITVQGTSRLAKKATEIAAEVIALLPPQKLEGWGRALILEGDLFVQAVVEGDKLIGLSRVPAVGMERLTNDADEFVDPDRAFAQLDVTTWQEIAVWSLALMSHVRWHHIDGDRYGTPEIIAVRRSFRKLDLSESSQTTRRMSRGSIFRLWKIGGDKQSGTPQDILEFKNANGFIEGKREPFDPMEVTRDFFGNGLVDCETIAGDPNIEKIEDLRYLQDVATAGLPTPKAVYGLDAESINRDILEDQRAEWLKDTRRLNEAIDEVIKFAFCLALMLAGIDPELIVWSTVWTRSSTERESDRIKSVLAIRVANLITRRTALSNIAEFVGVDDIDAELKEIEAETPAQQPDDYDLKTLALEASKSDRATRRSAAQERN